MLMRVVERPRGLAGDLHGVLDRQLPLPPEPVTQAFTVDKRHGEPELPGSLPRIEHSQDVGVLQTSGDLDFAVEPVGTEAMGQLR